ncbi:MAG: PIN domain-containing protein [Mycobacteriales bacterium]
MGLRPYYLGDTSAIARIAKPAVTPRLAPLIEAGLVARCTPTDLEAGYGARGVEDYERIRAGRARWPLAPINQATLDRASEVQALLAARSQHRGATIAGLIIAATAEAADLVVLHYDADFELIASVTGQAVEWVVAAGLAD